MLGVLTYLFYLLSKPNIPFVGMHLSQWMPLCGIRRPRFLLLTRAHEALVSFLQNLNLVECACRITLQWRIEQIALQNYSIFSDCANFLIIFAKIVPFVEVIEITKNECKWIKGKISVSIGSTKNEGNSLENPSFVKLCAGWDSNSHGLATTTPSK